METKDTLFTTLLALTFLAFISSCTEEKEVIKLETITEIDTVLVGPGVINVNLDNVVGDSDFALNTEFAIGDDTYQFDMFRYWTSNLSLINEEGDLVTIPNSYYLMEECGEVTVQDGAYTYPANKREQINLINIPKGSYTGLEFYVGVDATHNDNLSLQGGELSQLSGMTNIAWMWHTSYIFSALHGSQGETAFKIETGTNDTYRKVTIEFGSALEINAQSVVDVNINVDVAQILNEVNVSETAEVGANTPEIMESVADTYAQKVFTFESITQD